MCTERGIAYEEPNPNTFSFNSPYGACPTCRGLGAIYEVSMDAVMPDKTKSINEGGFAPLGEWRDNYAFRELRSLSMKHSFNFSQPISKIPKEAVEIILYGKNGKAAAQEESWTGREFTEEFDGIVNMIKQCFFETASEN